MKTRLQNLNRLRFQQAMRQRIINAAAVLIVTFLFTSFAATAQVTAGTAPVDPPTGGFAINGNLKVNSSIGDWLPGSGSGGNVLDINGVPLNNTTTFHLVDPFTSPDNNFSGGKKLDDDPNTWTWVTNPVNDKENINNVLLHFTHSSDGHMWVLIAADRKSNNGDAYIDFEFLQNTLSITGGGTSGGFSSGGPNDGRTVGDFLLTLELTNGGSAVNFFINRWQLTGSKYDYVDKTALTPAGSVFAAVNTADGTGVPYGAFGKTTYDKNTLVEAAIDLTALLGAIENCTELGIKTIMVKTKESQSNSATIVDFVAPLQTSLTIGVADAGDDQTTCTSGDPTTFNLAGKATPSPGDEVMSTTWSVVKVVPATETAVIAEPGSLATSVNVSDHATATLRFTVTTDKGCELSDDVVVSVTAGPAIYDLSSTNYCEGDPALGTVTLSSSQSGVTYQLYDADGALIQAAKMGTGNALTWTDIAAGSYYAIATVSGGCTSTTGTTTVITNSNPNAPQAEDQSNCGPGTVTLMASGCENGMLSWYDGNGNVVSTDASYTTPSLTTNTSYFVTCSTNGCESGRTTVQATIKTKPEAVHIDVQNNCDGTSTLTVSGLAGGVVLSWSDNVANHDNPRTVTTGGTYKAYQSLNGCSSDETSAMAAPKTKPTVGITVASQTCTGGVAQFTLTATGNGSSFTWSKPVTADGSFSTTTAAVTIYTPGQNDIKNGVLITLSTVLDGCQNSTNTSLRTQPCGPFYTYTQGYYSSTGTSCTPLGGVKGSLALIQYSITHMGGTLYLGKASASFTATYADAAALVKIMPGGGTATKLAKDYDLSTATAAPAPPLKNGKIDNILLSQTITLKLNLNIQGDGLNNFILKSAFLTTQKGDASSCPALKIISCSKDAGAISSMKITTNTALMTLLNGKTVTDLLNIASAALGGTLPTGVTYADITNAVDVINRSFDGGRFFLGYYTTQQSCSTLSGSSVSNLLAATDLMLDAAPVTVTAFPNPFTSRINFTIHANQKGKYSFDIYTLTGVKLHQLFAGAMEAGETKNIEFNSTDAASGIVYRLGGGTKAVTGIVIKGK